MIHVLYKYYFECVAHVNDTTIKPVMQVCIMKLLDVSFLNYCMQQETILHFLWQWYFVVVVRLLYSCYPWIYVDHFYSCLGGLL